MTTQALRGSLRVPRDSRAVARAVSAGVVATLLLSGCGSEPAGEGATTPSPSTEAASATRSPTPDKVVATMNDKTEAAVADLAATLGVPPSDVTVVSTEEVTWRDGSIGCPQKGMAYTQALVDGYLIILEVDGTQYRYHSSVTGAPFPCTANAQDPLPRGGGAS
jgi:hypothetical protein